MKDDRRPHTLPLHGDLLARHGDNPAVTEHVARNRYTVVAARERDPRLARITAEQGRELDIHGALALLPGHGQIALLGVLLGGAETPADRREPRAMPSCRRGTAPTR